MPIPAVTALQAASLPSPRLSGVSRRCPIRYKTFLGQVVLFGMGLVKMRGSATLWFFPGVEIGVATPIMAFRLPFRFSHFHSPYFRMKYFRI
jgi:hypothetical protein